MIDQFWRVTYWIGFRIARIWWWLTRPEHRGALVAIWLDGRILVIRQSYRAGFSWPGGGINRGEDPRDAAKRELAEELGLTIQSTDLVPIREMIIDWDFRHDHIYIFELRLDTEPVLTIDRREVIEARFIEPRILLAQKNLPLVIRAYLEDETQVPKPDDRLD